MTAEARYPVAPRDGFGPARRGAPACPSNRARSSSLTCKCCISPSGRCYTLERYGLRPGEVRETFSGYLAAFPGR